MKIKEDFIHFLWKTKRFDMENLRTTQGQPVQIFKFGNYNLDSGPDFLNGQVQIDKTLWIGNVEMHVNASDWLRHNHQTDPAFHNVILHVVWKEDKPVFNHAGDRLPCLEIRNRVPSGISKKYKRLMQNALWIPCQHQFNEISEGIKGIWMEQLLVERLEQKTVLVQQILNATQNDWEETFYQLVARYFGSRINQEPFHKVAETVPLRILARHRDSLLQLEALFLGQANFLNDPFNDAYPQKLKKEYHFLKKKYNLISVPESMWQFSRMRPAGFPTVRLVQLARLIHQTRHLFSKALAARNVKEVENMFRLEVSNYWLTHFIPDKASPKRNKKLGRQIVHSLLINAVVPVLFWYGHSRQDERIRNKALEFLAELPAEENKIIRNWRQVGFHPADGRHSQALIQLKNYYCDKKRCLECAIGNNLLKR